MVQSSTLADLHSENLSQTKREKGRKEGRNQQRNEGKKRKPDRNLENFLNPNDIFMRFFSPKPFFSGIALKLEALFSLHSS